LRLPIPLGADGEYLLHVEFTRISGSDCVGLFFPVLDKQSLLIVSGWDGGASSLALVGGAVAPDNATSRRPSILQNGKRYQLDLTVRGDKQRVSVSVMLDKLSIVDWEGTAASLGISQGWELPTSDTFGLMANEPVIFHKATLKVISGNTTLLKNDRR
jgi:hypothetical protein